MRCYDSASTSWITAVANDNSHTRFDFHMRLQFLVFLVAILPLASPSSSALADHKLRDFRRVVVADDANAVQLAAAQELAHYAGRVAVQPMAVMRWSEFKPQASDGLSFFIGPSVAERVLKTPL